MRGKKIIIKNNNIYKKKSKLIYRKEKKWKKKKRNIHIDITGGKPSFLKSAVPFYSKYTFILEVTHIQLVRNLACKSKLILLRPLFKSFTDPSV